MSDPLKKAEFTRNCWIEFSNEEQCQKALLHLNGVLIKSKPMTVNKGYTKLKRVKILKNYPMSRLEKDIETMKKLILKFDTRMGIDSNLLLNRKFETPQKNYDTLLYYLRKIHYFDYYTCSQFEN